MIAAAHGVDQEFKIDNTHVKLDGEIHDRVPLGDVGKRCGEQYARIALKDHRACPVGLRDHVNVLFATLG